jgi:hypothetical protein
VRIGRMIKLHVKGALNNGVTVEEIKAALLRSIRLVLRWLNSPRDDVLRHRFGSSAPIGCNRQFPWQIAGRHQSTPAEVGCHRLRVSPTPQPVMYLYSRPAQDPA